MAAQGLSKPGWNMPALASLAVHPDSDIEKKEKEQDDSKSTNGDAAKADDPESGGLPMSDIHIGDEEVVDPNDQAGVRKIEAITLNWSKRDLRLIYINMWLLYAVNAFQSNVTSNLSAYVTSDFEQHSLLPVAYIVSSAISAAIYLPLAKVLDLWGRAEGFTIMASMATLGLILMASCNSIQTFAAAQVFYSIGFGGLIYVIDCVTADTSTLKNRGLAYAFTASPWIITAFAGPPASESAYTHIYWRWGFGIFAAILPVVAAPFIYILKTTERKARAQLGDKVTSPQMTSQRTTLQSIWHYIIEFDAAGVLLFAAGLVIFLLPFSIADSAPNGWKSGYIIAMLVLGFVLLVSFAFFERYFAKIPFIPFKLLTSRTIFATLMLDATVQIAYYCWNDYYTSFLQVVYDVSITNAGYVGSTQDVVSGVWLFVVGILIAKTGYFKWLFIAAFMSYILGLGLMIHFRTPGTSIGYLFMCQAFIALGTGTITLVQQVSVLAASDHQHTAAVLALLSVFGWLGGSIGSTISGAIWTNTFEKALIRHLPDLDLETIESIYNDLTVQLEYPTGEATRTGIIGAYGDAQRYMLITGVCICATGLFWALLVKNINVSKIRQMKGTLF